MPDAPPGSRRRPAPIIRTLDACDLAAAMLRAAGYEVAHVSLRSEATYYRLPGRAGVIRVAAHRHEKPPIGLDPVLAKITFSPHKFSGPDHIGIREEAMRGRVYTAIGQHFVKSASPPPSKYVGPNPKNDRPGSVAPHV